MSCRVFADVLDRRRRVPLGTVYAIGQDADGYLWIGADAGLLRFDGLRFTHWDVLSDDTLPKSSVSALCVARDGSLWVGFADAGGIRRLRDGRIAAAQPRGSLGSVTDLVEDGHGTIWAVSDGALYRLRGDEWQKLMPVWEDDHRRFSIRQSIATVSSSSGPPAGCFGSSRKRTHFERIAAGYTWGISEDATGSVWITDIVAGFRRLAEPPSPPRPLEGAGYRLMHDRQGNLWVATLGEGLWRVRDASAASPVDRTAPGCAPACPATRSNRSSKIETATSGPARPAVCTG